MAQQSKRTSGNRTPSRSRKLSRQTQLIVAIAFAVVFVAVGAFYVMKSLAASEGCAYQLFGYGATSPKICIQMIQRTMTDLNQYVPSVDIPVAICNLNVDYPSLNLSGCNGVYGSQTEADVENFQRTNFTNLPPYGAPVTADGIVGFYTWRKICYVANYYSIHGAHLAVWPGEGCDRWAL